MLLLTGDLLGNPSVGYDPILRTDTTTLQVTFWTARRSHRVNDV